MLGGESWLIVLVYLGTVVRMSGESRVNGVVHLRTVVRITEKYLSNLFGKIQAVGCVWVMNGG